MMQKVVNTVRIWNHQKYGVPVYMSIAPDKRGVFI